MVGIIDQYREQDHNQQLEQAAYDAELQAHFSSSFNADAEWVTNGREARQEWLGRGNVTIDKLQKIPRIASARIARNITPGEIWYYGRLKSFLIITRVRPEYKSPKFVRNV